ncbi:hypothetical protein FZEAL_10056 [Fusarium zealandicum]|uniref:Fido domain-containing protein n=1 Tax=Fusarium zealandicum TaxID=1053134 RepID=A0A8H4U6A9_9HYPO|nr:hypothetical protein FZEAL_10056 [Fusarium zealandicum]
MPPDLERKNLVDSSEGLEADSVSSGNAIKSTSIPLGRSIRLLISSSLLGNGSVCTQSLRGIKATFTIGMDDAYDYSILEGMDPDDLHAEFKTYVADVAKFLKTSVSKENTLDQYFTDMLARMVFNSNMIENAGGGYDITFKLCKEVFDGNVVEDIIERHPDYEAHKRDLVRKNLPTGMDAVLRSRREIVQHAKATSYIFQSICIKGNDLTEEIILETHRILAHKVNTEDGTSWTQYAGVYRQCPVMAGLHQYMDHGRVPSAMKTMIRDLETDIQAAVETGEIDPVALAAKYCHIFVNIHPFLDGNGRMCRLILNAILLKYGGGLVCIGEDGKDRDEYEKIAVSASFKEASHQDDDYEGVPESMKPKPYKELASFTLRHARNNMRKVFHRHRS